MDGKGISTDELELVTKIVKPDLVYVIPDCHNPAGVNLNEERRKILVELAEERDFYVIEDDPYRPIAGCVPAPLKITIVVAGSYTSAVSVRSWHRV